MNGAYKSKKDQKRSVVGYQNMDISGLRLFRMYQNFGGLVMDTAQKW